MKTQTLVLIVIALGLSACSEKDQAYYLKHIDEAHTKMAQCIAELEYAFKVKDKAKIDTLMAENSECLIVDKALREHRHIEWEKMKAKSKKQIGIE